MKAEIERVNNGWIVIVQRENGELATAVFSNRELDEALKLVVQAVEDPDERRYLEKVTADYRPVTGP
jgi:hypothetical protein